MRNVCNVNQQYMICENSILQAGRGAVNHGNYSGVSYEEITTPEYSFSAQEDEILTRKPYFQIFRICSAIG